ncbi:MAG: pyrroline-5-carboxylate reductase [Solirubrobacterales bacterium]
MGKIIGFIGSGNMGQAMIGGIIKSGLVESNNVIVSDLDQKKLDFIAGEYKTQVTTDSIELVEKSDVIILAVKPNVYEPVLKQIKEYVTENKIIISIAPGKSLEGLQEVLGKPAKIVRAMPNTPALVNEGMAALCKNNNVAVDEMEFVKKLFESFGKAEEIQEYLFDSVIGVSGSSPAYVFMFIEALADAAVLGGMARDKAYKFAAQAVLGSAKMVLETGKHPGELKDMVCSPGGTTIEAVAVLEEEGFRHAVIKCVKECMNKSAKMSK